MDEAGLEKSYAAQHGAYVRTFERLGLDAISVESDTGAMGGDVAHEFQALTDVGEDSIAICENGDYSANLERATRRIDSGAETSPTAAPREISTPGTPSIDALEPLLKLPPTPFLTTPFLKD